MPEEPNDLLTIGAFAHATGLTASALRFYADTGVLAPADINPFTGYRSYHPDQVPTGIRVRQLRDAGVSLAAVSDILTSSPADAAAMVRRHIDSLVASTESAVEAAERIAADLTGAGGGGVGGDDGATPVDVGTAPTADCTVTGPVLAAAVDAVLPATVTDPDHPVLDTVLIELSSGEMRFIGTDRYRLTVRTVAPGEFRGEDWSGAITTTDLLAVLPSLRRTGSVRLTAHPERVRITGTDHPRSGIADLAVSDAAFPDYRLMLDSLPEPGARVTVDADALRRAVEDAGSRMLLTVGTDSLSVGDLVLDARTSGSPTSAGFALTTLYPALAGAVGPEVVLEFRGADQPLTVRSATRGDLTSVVMPVKEN